mgnify:CR=1 FL=1
MSDDDIDDPVDDLEDEEGGEELAAAGGDDDGPEVDESADGAPAAPKGKAKAAVSVDELPSVEAKNKERDALARAMEEFLAKEIGRAHV